MKILTRTLIILAVSAVVVGIVWLIGNSSLASSLDVFSGGGGEGNGGGGGGGNGGGNGRGNGNRNFSDGELSEGLEGREHDGAGSVQSWTGFLETLLPITIIIVVIRLAANAWDKFRRRNFPKPAV